MDKNLITKKRNYQKYPESIKRAVVLEYESYDYSQSYLSRKYGLNNRTIIAHWLRKYGNNNYLSVPKQQIIMPEDTPEVNALKARIKQLERELEDSKLLTEEYSLMITTAEEQLKIPIRKKFNTK